jgi:hypothetical protein
MASGNWWRETIGTVALYVVLATLGPGAARADEKPPGDKPDTQVDASKGGLTFRSGDNSVTFGAYVQVRGFLDDRELYDGDAKDTAGYGKEDGVVPSFDVARVRLGVRGTMFKPWVKYFLAIEAGRTPGESDNKIKDAYLELGKDVAALRAGQYKVPFSMQELVPDWGQQFTDRSVASVAFAPSRDTGVMLLGTGKAKKLGYSFGAFNGSGESRRQNNTAMMWALRVWLDPRGEYKLTEGAVDAPEKGVLHVGLAVRGGDQMKGGRTGVVEEPDGETALGFELAWKRHRTFLQGEAYWQRDQFANPTAGPDVDSLGGHVEAGFMVLPRRLELGVRWAQVDANQDTAGSNTTELRGGANYYWKGHNLKLQADVGRVTYGPSGLGRSSANRLPAAAGKDVVDRQARIQLQLYF